MHKPIVALTIDGRQISAKNGMTVYDAANEAGIYIPTLCHHPYLTPYGGCCLCIVEIENTPGFPTSCTMPVSDRMVVRTDTDKLKHLRHDILELILSEHPHTCLVCDRKGNCEPFRASIRKVGVTTGCQFCPKNKTCELQKVVDYVGIKEVTLSYQYKEVPVEKGDPFFDRDYNLCILCGRCVRVCQEVRGVGAISFTSRGNQALVGTAFGRSLYDSGCRFCAACVDICPTGALVEKRRKWEGPTERSIFTTCPYCGIGCQLVLEIKGERVIASSPGKGVNGGQACVRGHFGIVEIVNHPRRLKSPMIKLDGKLLEVTWDKALGMVAERLGQYHGDEVAVINCAECTNEDNYILQKFARVVLETNNIDHYERLCHAPTIAGLSRNLGSGVMTNSLSEIENAACILAMGIDMANSQPLGGVFVKRAVNNHAKVIIASPYWVGICRLADIWLQYRPGTEVVLLGGIMKVILDEGLEDISFIKERCEGFDSLVASLANYDLAYVARVTGISPPQIVAAARLFAKSKPAYTIYGEGLTQQYHGSNNVSAIADLILLTGNIGKPSSGVNPLVGLNNIQGACDMGFMPDFYPGYQLVANVTNRQRFEAAWGVKLNSKPGLTLTEMLDAIHKGQIKAAYVVGDDSALNGKLEGLEFLVVQGMFPSPASQVADIILPAASFVEKEGTFTNAERRVQLIRQAIQPIGRSKPDWWITCQIALRLGAKGFDFEGPSHIMAEVGSVAPIYGGISYDRLDKTGLQWPCLSGQSEGTTILHQASLTGNKSKFTALEFNSSSEVTDPDYPLIITIESSLYYFHAGAMSVNLGEFSVLAGESEVSVSLEDAAKHGINNNELVSIVSRWGETEAKVKVNSFLPVGVVSMQLHFMHNILNPVMDPVSKIPEYQVCAVKLEKRLKE